MAWPPDPPSPDPSDANIQAHDGNAAPWTDKKARPLGAATTKRLGRMLAHARQEEKALYDQIAELSSTMTRVQHKLEDLDAQQAGWRARRIAAERGDREFTEPQPVQSASRQQAQQRLATGQERLTELRGDYRKVTGRIRLLTSEQHTRQIIGVEPASTEEAEREAPARQQAQQATLTASGPAIGRERGLKRGGPSLS